MKDPLEVTSWFVEASKGTKVGFYKVKVGFLQDQTNVLLALHGLRRDFLGSPLTFIYIFYIQFVCPPGYLNVAQAKATARDS